MGGVVGAVVMAVWIVVYAVFSGLHALDPFVVEAGTWAGFALVARGHLASVFLGLATHFFVLAALGAVFGMIAAWFLAGERPTRYSAWGFVYGALIWLLAQSAALPTPNPALAGRVAPWAFAIGLVLFGSFAGSYVGSTAGDLPASQR